MEKIVPYLILIATIAAVGAVVLLVFSVLAQRRLFKNIISNKFTMHDIEEVDVENGVKTFSMIVSNRSMNDAAIASVGIVAGRDYFDFSKRYREQNSLTEESPIVIQPRMPIKLTFDILEVEKLLFASFPDGKFQKIKVYVVDSAGNIYESKAKNFGPILRKVHALGPEALTVQASTANVHVVGAPAPIAIPEVLPEDEVTGGANVAAESAANEAAAVEDATVAARDADDEKADE